jgi:hypothetical protein
MLRSRRPASVNKGETELMGDRSLDHWVICTNISRFEMLLKSRGRLDDAQTSIVMLLLSEARENLRSHEVWPTADS